MNDRSPRACVIGWPVAHSRSPVIHRFWLKTLKINGSYERKAVKPENLAGFLRNLEARGYTGANITVPHKQAAYRICNQVDELATALEAVNTVWLEEGRLHATNTDVHGFLANLDQAATGWSDIGRPAVVIGAGGAARAVLYGLIQRGFDDIRLINRTRAHAEELRSRFGSMIDVFSFEDSQSAIDGAGLLVNSTTLGMSGAPPLTLKLDPLNDDAVVCDIVYSPLQTPLLAEAARRGIKTVDGLGMLLHQAVPGFEIWFGERPDVTRELRHAVLTDLAGESC